MDASCIDESLFADGLRGKTLISFIASILYTIIFNKASNLSEHDNINYKMSNIIAAISAIECYMDQILDKYEWNNIFSNKQKVLLKNLISHKMRWMSS